MVRNMKNLQLLITYSGLRNGLNPRSLGSKASNVRNLPDNHDYMASEPLGQRRQYLHGGGSRYIQQNTDEYYTEGNFFAQFFKF